MSKVDKHKDLDQLYDEAALKFSKMHPDQPIPERLFRNLEGYGQGRRRGKGNGAVFGLLLLVVVLIGVIVFLALRGPAPFPLLP